MTNVDRAPLPDNYSAACTALADCQRIDECKSWADKAQALASYARQSKDESLRKTADRIQARAIRRCGELLREYNAKGKRTDIEPKGPVSPKSRKEAGKQAGLSQDQVKDAVRVANVAPALFESQVESENPPTVTELAEQGKKKQPRKLIDLGTVAPLDFQAATQASGWVHQFCQVIESENLAPDKVARGLQHNDKTIRQFRADLMTLGSWAATIISLIGV